MYWKYCVTRICSGVAIFVIIIFIFSALFNTVAEETARGQIAEALKEEMSGLRGMSHEELICYREMRFETMYHRYHLDRPLGERIIWRAIDTLTLNFGKSITIKSKAQSEDVWTIVSECIPATVLLFTTAIIIDILLGLWLGLKKAQRAGGVMDKGTSIGTMIVYGMPAWWLGMIIIMIFAYAIKIFPSGGLYSTPRLSGIAFVGDVLYHMALPVLTLVIIGFWARAYLTRNIVLGVLQDDYIMAARARGIPEDKVLYGHTMRTAAPPIVTMALLSLLVSFMGNIIFEGVFSWPGMGNLYWIAVQQNDVPVLMGNLTVTTALYLAGLVILDLIYGFLDPRIKVGGRR
jgi:peptide/nickel transport system permease protein